jgi:hypothetical protein
MKEVEWKGWKDFISQIIELGKPLPDYVNLFRGQPCDKPLLPKIARENPYNDPIEIEKRMLNELKLRGKRFFENDTISDLDLLTIAQHHGMATRLLDWSTNPLVALWLSCIEDNKENGHFYFYRAPKDVFYDSKMDNGPFELLWTKIFCPCMNNSRIIAQNGWFSIHKYIQHVNPIEGKNGEFIKLESDMLHFLSIYHFEIPIDEKSVIIEKLNCLGINYEYLFPDIDGLCKNINYNFGYK